MSLKIENISSWKDFYNIQSRLHILGKQTTPLYNYDIDERNPVLYINKVDHYPGIGLFTRIFLSSEQYITKYNGMILNKVEYDSIPNKSEDDWNKVIELIRDVSYIDGRRHQNGRILINETIHGVLDMNNHNLITRYIAFYNKEMVNKGGGSFAVKDKKKSNSEFILVKSPLGDDDDEYMFLCLKVKKNSSLEPGDEIFL